MSHPRSPGPRHAGTFDGRNRGKALLCGEAELRFTIRQWLRGRAGRERPLRPPSQTRARRGRASPPFRYWWPAVVVGARVLAVKATHSNVAIDYAVGRDGQHGLYFDFAEAF